MVEENNLDKYYVPTKNDKCGNYTTWRKANGIMLNQKECGYTVIAII